jgi:hypothetical protein
MLLPRRRYAISECNPSSRPQWNPVEQFRGGVWRGLTETTRFTNPPNAANRLYNSFEADSFSGLVAGVNDLSSICPFCECTDSPDG